MIFCQKEANSNHILILPVGWGIDLVIYLQILFPTAQECTSCPNLSGWRLAYSYT